MRTATRSRLVLLGLLVPAGIAAVPAVGQAPGAAVQPLPAVAAAPVPQPAAARAPIDVVLEDQFKNRRGTASLRGDVVVLVYAARHGAEAALDVGRALHLRFHPTADGAEAESWSTQPVVPPAGWPAGVRVPDVHVIPIACVPEVPRALHAVARSRLRQESPHVSVWLDFDDVMRQQFGMIPDEPNVAVIDTRGVVHGVRSGHVEPAVFEDLVRVVDRLRLESLQGVRTAAVPAGLPPAAVTPAAALGPGGLPAGTMPRSNQSPGGVIPAGGRR